MKATKPLLGFAAFFLMKFSLAQTPFYYYESDTISLEQSLEKVYVKFKDGLTTNDKLAIASSSVLIDNPKEEDTRHPNDIAIFNIVPGQNVSTIKALVFDTLNHHPNVIVSSPFFRLKADSTLVGLTERFYVKLKSPNDYTNLLNIAIETNTKISLQNEFDPSVYIVIADKYSAYNSMLAANIFHETGMFEYAAPSFIRMMKMHCVNDPLFDQQWGLQNTGQHGGTSGADIKACQAWGITKGRDDIVIAVLDSGVDLEHPDLVNNLLLGFDATGQGSEGGQQGNDAHGTACAGIIAAQGNNMEGVSGIAPNCKILPVRIAYNEMSDGTWTTDDIWMADGINWAWQNGADILSNSWGAGPVPLITDAINNAFEHGRDGLGCPIVFSSGNSNTDVAYPAGLPNVISVGASDMCDQRQRLPWPEYGPFNPFGGYVYNPCYPQTWGSNYGINQSLVAPGVVIRTTDVSGVSGYESGDYYLFNGTSASSPFVAGTMALMLSVNRCLTATEARNALELSCDKVGPYCYGKVSGKPNGAWNVEMGYGRLNAYDAVRYALSTNMNNSYENVTGSSQGANECSGNYANLCVWQVASSGCSGLAAANYLVRWHRVEANITYPYTPNPTIKGTANGLSFASPNLGNYYMGVSNVTPTSATLFTYVYETYAFTLPPQLVGWKPTSPQNIRFNYHVIGAWDQNMYLQNRTVLTGMETHNAMNWIEAGRSVTTSIPEGDYVVEGNASVVVHAGDWIRLAPGTVIEPDEEGSFIARIGPFFTCEQYPKSLMGGFPPVIENYEAQRLHASYLPDETNASVRIFPNPFSEDATLEYSIDGSETVEITIHDNCGRPLYKLKNRSPHEAGSYQVRLSGVNLESGLYHCVIRTDRHVDTKEFIIAK